MRTMNCITGRKLHAGLKKAAGRIKGQSGGGLGVIFIGLTVTFLVVFAFINISDYAVYTYKRNSISKAIDYAVTAAVQDIDREKSFEGLAEGFDETTGRRLSDGVEIDIDRAEKTFLSVFNSNCNKEQTDISRNLLICATFARAGRVSYKIKTSSGKVIDGTVDSPNLIEDRINDAAKGYWPDSDDNSSRIAINGNPKTNMIDRGTYLFAYIKGIRITGVFTERELTLSCFGGAKLDRANAQN